MTESAVREERTTDYSKTEITHVLKYEDINGQGRLFGGRLMGWIDETGGMTAMRHAGLQVTTACVDNLQFKRGAKLNDMVVLVGRVTYVGNASIEVRVDSYLENAEGLRSPINRAYLIYVTVDGSGDPVRVPFGLKVETESERAEWEGACLRRTNRQLRRQEGY